VTGGHFVNISLLATWKELDERCFSCQRRHWPVHTKRPLFSCSPVHNALPLVTRCALCHSATPTQLSLENANGSLQPQRGLSNNKLLQLVTQTWVTWPTHKTVKCAYIHVSWHFDL
jgi:hypothetical protein